MTEPRAAGGMRRALPRERKIRVPKRDLPAHEKPLQSNAQAGVAVALSVLSPSGVHFDLPLRDRVVTVRFLLSARQVWAQEGDVTASIA